jgi:hypothetical protein
LDNWDSAKALGRGLEYCPIRIKKKKYYHVINTFISQTIKKQSIGFIFFYGTWDILAICHPKQALGWFLLSFGAFGLPSGETD